VGSGTEVTIHEETAYPFRETVDFRISTPRTVRFPILLRVPQWCAAAKVAVNGEATAVASRPLAYSSSIARGATATA